MKRKASLASTFFGQMQKVRREMSNAYRIWILDSGTRKQTERIILEWIQWTAVISSLSPSLSISNLNSISNSNDKIFFLAFAANFALFIWSFIRNVEAKPKAKPI